jgi:hypothetical protein
MARIKTMDALIQTGRTTSMVKEANESFNSGNKVVILVPTLQMGKIMVKVKGVHPGIKLVPISDSEAMSRFDWRSTTFLAGENRSAIVFIDHSTIEHHFKELLEVLHRYDNTYTEAAR